MKTPEFLSKTSRAIEFWVDPETQEVMAMYQGIITKFEDASVDVGSALMKHIVAENQFELMEAEGFTDAIELMKEYIRRYFAEFDHNTDLNLNGHHKKEYTGHALGINPGNLTDREIEYIQLTAMDLSDKMIADSMGCAYNTVCKHRSNAQEKTGSHSKSGLISWAYREGVL